MEPTPESPTAPDPAAPPPATSLTHRASWLLTAKFLSFAFAVVLPLLLVRRLDQHTFGIYKLIFLVVNTAVNLLPFGFGMSAYYFLPRERDRQSAVILNILLFLTLMGVAGGVVVTLFPQILVFVAQDPNVAPFAPWIGVLIALWIVGAFLEIAPLANQEARLASLLILGSQLSRTLVLVAAAVIFGTVHSLIVVAVIQGVLQIAVLWAYLARRFPRFWNGLDGAMLVRQLSYALPLGVAGMLYTFQTDMHNYFVSHRFGAASFAVYSIGCFQVPLVGMLTEAAASVLIPRVSELEKLGNAREIIGVTLRATRKLSAAIFPLYAFLMVVAGEFLSFLFTPQYLASRSILRVNLTLLPFNALLIDPMLRAFAQYRYHLLAMRIALCSVLFASLAWATSYAGMIGAISVVVGISLIERTILVLFFGRVLRFSLADAPGLQDLGKLALSAGLAAAACAGVRWLLLGYRPLIVLLVSGAAFSLVYLGLVFLLKVPTQDEKQLLGRLLRRPWQLVAAR